LWGTSIHKEDISIEYLTYFEVADAQIDKIGDNESLREQILGIVQERSGGFVQVGPGVANGERIEEGS
jgi:hypothetical protein